MNDVLAIDGGEPVRKDVKYEPWPSFDGQIQQKAVEILASGKVNYWTGNEGKSFEKEFAEYCGAKHCVLVSNGTVALEVALKALGVGKGDEVIVTSRTFLGSASCILECGAVPIFADVDLDSQNVTAETIAPKISEKTKAIICVHLAGWPCDMDPIMELANCHNLYVIEDCAQAHGAKYKGKVVGSIGHINAYSFCQDKIITTAGEGGAVLTNCKHLWEKVWSYKDHGKNYNTVFNKKHPPGFRWLHESPGTNARMTEIQSAVGRIALSQLDDWVSKRRDYAMSLVSELSSYSFLRVPMPSEDFFHTFYRFYCFVVTDKLPKGWDRDRIMNSISAEGVPCFSGSCSEIYLEKVFQNRNYFPKERLENAVSLGDESLCFLTHPTLSTEDKKDTISALHKVLSMVNAGIKESRAAA